MATEGKTFESEIFESGNFDDKTQFRGLSRAIAYSDSFSLLFARCNQRPSQKKLIDRLKVEFPDKKIEVVFFNQPIKHLLDELRKISTASQPALVLVYGLESSVESVKNAKKNVFIKNLNASRNSFPHIFNCPIVLFLPEYIISAIMLGATDFFSVRSGVFYFESESDTLNSQSQEITLIDDYEIGSLTTKEVEFRVNQIKLLLKKDLVRINQIPLHLALGDLYYNQANFRNALIELNKAKKLAHKERDQNYLALCYNSLAKFYLLQGNYRESQPFCNKAIVISEKYLGIKSVITATSYSNLATFYALQHEYEESQNLIKKALKIREEVLGENHPSTTTSYNDLASIYKIQHKYAEAESLYLKALKIRKFVLGENHSWTATLYNNLSDLYNSQGKYKESELLNKKAIIIYETILGKHHLITTFSYNNLGVLYANQGKYAEAKVWLEKALIIRQNVLGNEHHYTIGTRQSLENVEKMLA